MTTNIIISNGLMTIGTKTFDPANYSAHAEGTNVVIVHRNNDKNRLEQYNIGDVKLNNTSYNTPALFCAAFNALAGGKIDSDILHTREEATDIRANTDYPTHIVSRHTTIGAQKAKAADFQKPGYLEIEADENNAGVVYVGDTNVSAASRNLKAGKKAVFEVDDLSKIYILGSVADQVVEISGGYKD